MRYLFLFLWILLFMAACDSKVPQQRLVFYSDSTGASISDFALYQHEDSILIFKDMIRNRIDIFNSHTGALQASIMPLWHRFGATLMQSLTVLHPDTLLVLMRTPARLYFFDRYGHNYHQIRFGPEYFHHFSLGVNTPYIYQRAIHIPMLPILPPEADVSVSDFRETLELLIDLDSRKLDTIRVAAPALSLPLLGLRHQLATRTRADDRLVYLWGYGGQIAILNLANREVTYKDLPLQPLVLDAFTGDFTDNKLQQEYYYSQPSYHHITYDKYRQYYYIFRLDRSEHYLNKHHRSFSIYVLNKNFKLIDSLAVEGKKFLIDHQAVHPEGLFMAQFEPADQTQIVFEKVY